MQVSVETTSNLGRRMTVQVPADRIDSEVEKRLTSMSRRVKIDGFRPGKVPFKVVKRRFGDDVQQEVVGEVLQASFQQALSDEQLRPAGRPHIEPEGFGEGKGLTYTASFEVYPTFELASLQDVKLERPQVEVTEEDIERMLETLRKQRRSWHPVERAAREGDQVVMDFAGRLDGEILEGGSGESVELELGSERMIPGFEAELVGAHSGEDRTFSIEFPQEHPQTKLAGQSVSFEVHVQSVSEAALPELDEDFAQGFGIEEGGMEALRQAARDNMQHELEQKIRSRLREQVMAALVERHELELPDVLVNDEVESLRHQAMERTGRREPSEFPDEWFMEEAQRRVKLGLIVGEIANRHDLRADHAQVDQALRAMASAYDDPESVIAYYHDNREARAGLEAQVLEQQVVEWVQSRAEVVDVPMSFDALMNPEKTENPE